MVLEERCRGGTRDSLHKGVVSIMTASNKVFLFRQNAASQGAKLLSRSLGIKMIKPENSSFRGSSAKTIINWGSGSEFPFDLKNTTVLNTPDRVAKVTNKRTFFEMCREHGGVDIPDFTTRKIEALDWLRGGSTVFARTILQGSGGEGIVDIQTEGQLNEIQEGTLLVKYVKKKKEFRIHVADGGVINQQEKKKKGSVPLESINWRIRNHDGGFVFCREGVNVPRKVTDQAKLALEVSGLCFGAVDVLWNAKHQRAVVLEINTAPGLEGSTVISYQNFFKERLGLVSGPEVKDRYDIEMLAVEHGIRIGDPDE